MSDWCSEHPWMTFVIAVMAIEEVARLARVIVKRARR